MQSHLTVYLKRFRFVSIAVVALLTIGLACQMAPERQPGRIISPEQSDGEWRMLGRDLAFTRYSPLDQINADNFNNLEIVWRWKQANFGPSPETGGQTGEATPIYVDGVLYTTAGSRRAIAALDPATGETLWAYRPDEDPERWEKAPRKSSGRGVSFWTDGQGDNRIYLVSRGFYLFALDADTGEPIQSFGENGRVDLMANVRVREGVDPVGTIGSTTPPTIVNDVIVVGPSLAAGFRPPSYKNTPGDVQAFDVRTGALKWVFHTIPEDGEPGVETWEGGSNNYTGNTGVWSSISADAELGYVYLPVEAPTNDYYGGHRLGDNLYGNSVVCLEAATGNMVWYYQLVHHDIWDYDNPAAPILADVTIDGQARKIVVQNTKQGFSYVFDRVTGEPIWPMEEKPVPASDVPGERASPTQPFPTKPPAWEQQGITEDDLVDFTPRIKRLAVEAMKGVRMGPLFTPPSVGTDDNFGTFVVPGASGGVNWNMSSFDPVTGVNYIGSTMSMGPVALTKPREGQSDMDFTQGFGARPSVKLNPDDRNERGIPVVKPPWASVIANDLNTGERLWRVPNGDTPQEILDHPLMRGVKLSEPTGQGGNFGTMVSRTLVFTGESDPEFHAYNKETGARVGTVKLPAEQSGLPMTYMHDGRQYIVMTVMGGGLPAELVALALPAQQ